MSDQWISALLGVATTGAALMAGVYFAFSSFVMKSLQALENHTATEVMNSINTVILRSWFIPFFFGTTLLYLLIALLSALSGDMPGRWLLFVSGIIYVGGMFLCTLFFNVPLNNQLRDVNGVATARTWLRYQLLWTRWNHVRTLSSALTAVISLYYLAVFV